MTKNVKMLKTRLLRSASFNFMDNIVLEYKDAVKKYKNGETELFAVDHISTQFKKGEFVCVVGPSGSGKSTFLYLGSGVETLSEGKVFLLGCDISQYKKRELSFIRNTKIGFIFQSFNLFPVLTAKENVEYPCFLYKESNKNAKRSDELLKLVGLENEINKKVTELSGGQKQRVAIARSLINNPEIVFADEMTASLDKKNALEVMKLLLEINKKFGTTFIFSTHDEKIMNTAKRIICIEDGKIVSDKQNNNYQRY